jgi:DDB1- and CUL4-associated factor 13
MVPKQSLEGNGESILACKFNKVEESLIAFSTRDRGIFLYDMRSNEEVKKFFMKHKTNDISWNPQQPFKFSIANEDQNCYTFDIRKIEKGPFSMHIGIFF